MDRGRRESSHHLAAVFSEGNKIRVWTLSILLRLALCRNNAYAFPSVLISHGFDQSRSAGLGNALWI